MIVEFFVLIKNAKNISKKIKQIKSKENFSSELDTDVNSLINLLKTYLILIIVCGIIYIGLTIWAIIDAWKKL